MINRPGVAGAVLKSPPSFIDSLTDSSIESYVINGPTPSSLRIGQTFNSCLQAGHLPSLHPGKVSPPSTPRTRCRARLSEVRIVP